MIVIMYKEQLTFTHTLAFIVRRQNRRQNDKGIFAA